MWVARPRRWPSAEALPSQASAYSTAGGGQAQALAERLIESRPAVVSVGTGNPPLVLI